VSDVVGRLIERLAGAADELGCLPYLERCRQMAAAPTWADRQIALRRQLGDAPEMVRQLVAESRVTPAPGLSP
jgi:hypothetical protein